MNKFLIKLSLFFSFLFSILIFCSFSRNKINTVKGYVNVYGNDHFSFIGIETTDNKKYALDAEKSVDLELRKSQGYLIEVKGIIFPKNPDKLGINMLKDGKIEVISWKFVNLKKLN